MAYAGSEWAFVKLHIPALDPSRKSFVIPTEDKAFCVVLNQDKVLVSQDLIGASANATLKYDLLH